MSKIWWGVIVFLLLILALIFFVIPEIFQKTNKITTNNKSLPALSENCIDFEGTVTLSGKCYSKSKPYICDGSTGNLLSDCILCGCDEGQTCNLESKECGFSSSLLSCGKSSCPYEHYSCIDDKCVLNDNINYEIGYVYVYDSNNTYNPNWRNQLDLAVPKVEKALDNLSSGRINVLSTIIGKVNTNFVCWNPAEAGIKCYNGNTFRYVRLPGSSFGGGSFESSCERIEVISSSNKILIKEITKPVMGQGNINCQGFGANVFTSANQCYNRYAPFFCDGSTGKLVEDCTLCGCESYEGLEGEQVEQVCDIENGRCKLNSLVNIYNISISCKDSLPLSDAFTDSKNLNSFKKQISEKLNFSFEDYDYVFILFGKFGAILQNESSSNLNYKCSTSEGIIGGYSNGLSSENSFLWTGGLVNCDPNSPLYSSYPFYERTGWHVIVHELLHQFGAVDVYSTGLVFTVGSEKDEALKVDPLANESIMGDEERDCMKDFSCKASELERVYLDKYNLQKMGW